MKTILVLLLTSLVSACAIETPSEGVEKTDAEWNEILSVDPDVKELVQIRDELTERAVNTQVDPEVLDQAYKDGDEEKISTLMGFSSTEIANYTLRLGIARTNLLRRYPEFAAEVERHSVSFDPVVKSAAFFANYESNLEQVASKRGPCKWFQFTACLMVATTAGPVLYWPAAFLCWCAFCKDNEEVCGL